VIQEQIRWWCEKMCVAGAVASSSHPCMLSLNDEGKFASHHPSTEEPPRSIARRVTRLCTLQCKDASLICAKVWAVIFANI
jgi:hypothetical protein